MKRSDALFIVLLSYFILIWVSQNFTSINVEAEPALTIDDTYVMRHRCDVDKTAYFGFHVIYSSDKSPLQFGVVHVNEVSGYWQTNSLGWVFIPFYSNEVGNYSVSIKKIYYGNSELDFQQIVPNPWCVFDEILIDLSTPAPRIGVNTSAFINYIAKYAYDYTTFKGKINLNHESLLSSKIVKRTYRVDSIEDDLYGITKFRSNSVDIIYDKVDVHLSIDTSRISIGTDADINVSSVYSYDNKEFHGKIYFNDTIKKDVVGKYIFTVSSIYDNNHNVNSFASNSIEIIFDEVIIELEVEDDRINIGNRVNLFAYGKYAYDSKPFVGQLEFNYGDFKSNNVCKRVYYVTKVNDEKYDLKAFTSNQIEIIWDKVNVRLMTENQRINIYEEAKIIWDAYYEYDGSDFKGEMILNSNSFSKDVVGKFTYEIYSIEDKVFGITNFTCNPVTIIWDKIKININFENERLEAGVEVHPIIHAEYEYDGSPFEGGILLNDTLLKYDIGKFSYIVSSIKDQEHGITNFESNIASCYYDRIVLEKVSKSNLPGSFQINYFTYYESDTSPVNNANITINNKKANYQGDGIYQLKVSNWKPQYKIQTIFSNPGFSSIYDFGYYICIGNVSVYTFLGAFAISSTLFLLRKRKRKIFEREILDVLESKGLISFFDLINMFNTTRNEIVNITMKALMKGKISGIISYDKNSFITESKLQSITKLDYLTLDDIVKKINQIKIPHISMPEYEFKGKLDKFFYIDDPSLNYYIFDIKKLNIKDMHLLFEQLKEPMKIESFNSNIFTEYLTCKNCNGLGWMSITDKHDLIEIYKYNSCPYCNGKGYHEYSLHINDSSVLLMDIDFGLWKLDKELIVLDRSVKILDKQIQTGRKILELTPRDILYFDHALPNKAIIMLSPTLFSKKDRQSATIVDGVFIPERDRGKSDINDHEVRADDVYLYEKRDAKRAGKYRKKLRG